MLIQEALVKFISATLPGFSDGAKDPDAAERASFRVGREAFLKGEKIGADLRPSLIAGFVRLAAILAVAGLVALVVWQTSKAVALRLANAI